jgi:hypothetical protein
MPIGEPGLGEDTRTVRRVGFVDDFKLNKTRINQNIERN